MNRTTIFLSLLLLTGCANLVTDMADIPIRVTTNLPRAIVVADANTFVNPAYCCPEAKAIFR